MADYEFLRGQVQSMLGSHRLGHTLSVVDEAVELARRYGEDENRARTAAILHDCAKELSKNHLLNCIEYFGIVLDDVERCIPALWHASVGAALASDKFGITDEDILNAIRYHTVGRSGMSRLEKIVYLADSTEPQRQFPGVDRLRELARRDLDLGCVAAFESSIRFNVDRGVLLHPNTVEARNDLITKRERGDRDDVTAGT